MPSFNENLLLVLLVFTSASTFFQGLWCLWGKNKNRNGMGIGYPIFIIAMVIGVLSITLKVVLGWLGLQALDINSLFYILVEIVVIIAFVQRDSGHKLDPFFSLMLTLIGIVQTLVGTTGLCIAYTALQNPNVYIRFY